MRGIFPGIVAGLLMGSLATVAYSRYARDETLADSSLAELAAARADLQKERDENQQLKSRIDTLADQIQKLNDANDSLKKQGVAAVVPATTAAPAQPPVNPLMLAGMAMARGGFQTQQRLLLLRSRLHLSPAQEAAIKAAMDADAKARRDLMRNMFQGKPSDPAAVANANTLDKVLAATLNPGQLADYQKVQADEKTSQADTMATVQVNQVAPLLQLTDAQKDQVFNAIYQVQAAAPDPTTLIGNPNAMSVISAQSQATEAALKNILTPDQMVLYQQASQMNARFPGFGGGRRGGGQ